MNQQELIALSSIQEQLSRYDEIDLKSKTTNSSYENIVFCVYTSSYRKYFNRLADSFAHYNPINTHLIGVHLLSINSVISAEDHPAHSIASEIPVVIPLTEANLPCFSANCRFHVALKLLNLTEQRLLYVDCDSLFLNNPDYLFEKYKNFSIVLKKHPMHRHSETSIYFPIKSGFFLLDHTSTAKLFLTSCNQAILGHTFKWYSDQVAITLAYYQLSSVSISAIFCKPCTFSWNLWPNTFIYTAKGIRKNLLSYRLLRILAISLPQSVPLFIKGIVLVCLRVFFCFELFIVKLIRYMSIRLRT